MQYVFLSVLILFIIFMIWIFRSDSKVPSIETVEEKKVEKKKSQFVQDLLDLKKNVVSSIFYAALPTFLVICGGIFVGWLLNCALDHSKTKQQTAPANVSFATSEEIRPM